MVVKNQRPITRDVKTPSAPLRARNSDIIRRGTLPLRQLPEERSPRREYKNGSGSSKTTAPGVRQTSNIQVFLRGSVKDAGQCNPKGRKGAATGLPPAMDPRPRVAQRVVRSKSSGSAMIHPLQPDAPPFDGVHRPFLLIFSSAHLLGTICQVSGVFVNPLWMPTVVGGVIGAGFALLNRYGLRRYWREPSDSLNVVITGSTRGIGKAIARELLRKGDAVMVTSSNPANVRQAMKELRNEVGSQAKLFGIEADVSSPGAVTRLANAATSQMGNIDVWINNAGYSGRYQSFMDTPMEQMQEVVQTNLVGALLCSRAAWQVMQLQPEGGHIFNLDGAGADGLPTPNYAVYGATKAGIAHLMGSLNEEMADYGAVRMHTLSPGMVLTPLLLEGATDRNKRIFNILCEQPETVAAYLAPRLRNIAARGGVGKYVRFLTGPKALARLLSAPFAINRFFGNEGQALYAEEHERILSPSQAKITRRLAQRAARRDRTLAITYSLSLALAYGILVIDSQGALPRLPFS